jgi:pilus assembly protein Flp/PilA
MIRSIKALLTHTKGATSIEYALIAMLVAMAVIGGVQLLGTEVKASYDNTASAAGSVFANGAATAR